jgi:hypothetical protein
VNGWIVIGLVVALLVLLAVAKPTKTLVGGIFQRDRKGRLVLVLTPVRRKRRWK